LFGFLNSFEKVAVEVGGDQFGKLVFLILNSMFRDNLLNQRFLNRRFARSFYISVKRNSEFWSLDKWVFVLGSGERFALFLLLLLFGRSLLESALKIQCLGSWTSFCWFGVLFGEVGFCVIEGFELWT
jgi:hypothetical protein